MGKKNLGSVKVTCTKCQGTFGLSSVDVVEEEVQLCDEPKKLILTFYTCPECGKVYTVLVDDEKTLKLKAEYIQSIQSINYLKRVGKKVSKNMIDRMYQLQGRLKAARDDLNSHYNGSFYQLKDHKEQLDINVPDVNSGEGGFLQ